MIVDDTIEAGGPGDGFRPTEPLLGALTACMAGTMINFADNQSIAISAVSMQLEDRVEKKPTRIAPISEDMAVGADVDERQQRTLVGGARAWRDQGRVMTTDPCRPRSRPPLVQALRLLMQGSTGMMFSSITASHIARYRTFAQTRSLRVIESHHLRSLDHGAERGGEFPGARHLPYERLLNDDGTFLDAGEMGAVLSPRLVCNHRKRSSPIADCRLPHGASLGLR